MATVKTIHDVMTIGFSVSISRRWSSLRMKTDAANHARRPAENVSSTSPRRGPRLLGRARLSFLSVPPKVVGILSASGLRSVDGLVGRWDGRLRYGDVFVETTPPSGGSLLSFARGRVASV